MLLITNLNESPIQISPEIESFKEFSWEDLPAITTPTSPTTVLSSMVALQESHHHRAPVFQKRKSNKTKRKSLSKTKTSKCNDSIRSLLIDEQYKLRKQNVVVMTHETESFEHFGWESFPLLEQHSSTMFSPSSLDESTRTSNSQNRNSKDDKRKQTTVTKRRGGSSSFRKANNNGKNKKVVTFGSIRIRKYNVTVGDYTSTTRNDSSSSSFNGIVLLPITLDWDYVDNVQDMYDDVQEYDSLRTQFGDRLPKGRLPKLDYFQRRFLLRYVGGMKEAELKRIEKFQLHQQQERPTASGIMASSIKRSQTVTRFPSNEEKQELEQQQQTQETENL